MVEVGYNFNNEFQDASHKYLIPQIRTCIESCINKGSVRSILDFGCGNGSLTAYFAKIYPDINFIGVDPSPFASRYHDRNQCKNLNFIDWEKFITGDTLSVDLVLSVEVIEHVFLPRSYVSDVEKHLKSSRSIIVTTPYHGYWKNIAISLVGGWDKHFTALWDYGHIKFWSFRSLDLLFAEFGFTNNISLYSGRFYPLSKSIVKLYKK